jgi:membrane-associated phospholipid phosphatase
MPIRQAATGLTRLRPLLAFIQARLTPGGYLGLHLTIGTLVLLACGWGFAQVVDALHKDAYLARADAVLAQWLHDHASRGLTRLMLAITALGAPGLILATAAVLAVALARRGDRYGVMGLVLSVPVGMVINSVFKNIFDRARPQFDPVLALASGFSFPSGHTAGATLLYGFLAVHTARRLSSWHARLAVLLAAFFTVALVGLSRLYLTVHYLTDVLAAACASTAGLAGALTAVESLRLARTARAPAGPRAT